MAKQHRLRVVVAYDENNRPIIKQLAANSEIALADMAIKAIIKSGRIAEFMPELIDRLTAPQNPSR